MPDILRGSILISFILKVISVFGKAYKLSFLKKIADKINICIKESVIFKILRKYVYKEPFYRYSLTYRLVFRIANLFDKLFGGIFRIFKSMLFGSEISDGFSKIYNMSLTDKCYFAGGLLISIPVGAAIAGILLNNFNEFTFIICWAMFFVGVMVVIIAIYGKNSVLVKLFRSFINIIK
ncbi:MAG: hypothetical protein ACI4VF_04995 [Lachnospirales bacterium]